MDGLQYGRAFYRYPSAAPFDPFVVISLNKQRNMNGFDGPTAFVFWDFFPIIINVMWLSRQTIDTPFSDLSRVWKFYGTSRALIFISSFWETFSSFSTFFNLCLWSPKLSKIPNFILVSLLYFESPLMVDFVSLRQQAPFVSFFFARLGVFLEHSGGKCPQVGLFLPVVLLLDLS